VDNPIFKGPVSPTELIRKDAVFETDAERLLASIYHFHQDVTCRCMALGALFDRYVGQRCCDNFGCPRKFDGMRDRIAQYFGDGDVEVGAARLSRLRKKEDRDQWREVDGGHGDQIRAVLETGVLAVWK